MSQETFEQHFIRKFDVNVQGLNLPIMPVLRINTLIMQTFFEVAEFRQMHVDAIALEHEAMGHYMLTVNHSTTIRLQVKKVKEAAHA